MKLIIQIAAGYLLGKGLWDFIVYKVNKELK